MVTLVTVGMLVTVLGSVSGFNLHTNLAKVFQGPNQTHFGYSVTLWKDPTQGSLVVVGAPRGKNRAAGAEELPLGNLHFYNASNWEEVPFTALPSVSEGLSAAIRLSSTVQTQGIGFGENLVTSPEPGSPLVACAPRYLLSFRLAEDRVQGRGACYVLQQLRQAPITIVPNPEKQHGVNWNDHRYTGTGMTGFSAAQSENYLYMGSPNSFYGQGAVMRRSTDGKDITASSKNTYGEVQRDFSNEGWSTVVGKFDGRSLFIATSIPNNEVLKGLVTFYNLNLMAQKVQLSGEDMGAKYGYSLAAGDLDADGAHDLVVGAPLAPGQLGAPDAGKIYVYYAPLKEHVSRATLILRGQHSWGHFGLAVTCPGDLNQDGYEDVVVGAPEAAGTAGIIYVYNGGADGLTPHPTQVIRGGDIPGGVSGLGFSLSTGLDIDLNGYPDLVAGSALSDTAVVIRTSPVVTLIGEVTFDRLIISLENKTCMVTPQGSQVSEDVACLNVVINLQYTSKVTDQLEVNLDMELDVDDSRLAFLDTQLSKKSQRINATNSQLAPLPVELSVYVKPGRVHLQSPVSMVVSASLHQVTPEGVQEGLSRVPNTLNILGDTTFTAHARIGCVDAASCFSKPDLHLSARVTSEFTVGDGKLVVEVMVHSRNDSAYSVQLVLGYQQQLVFQRVSGSSLIPTCKPADSNKDQRSYLTCKFTSDFHKEEQVTLRFHLEYTPEILLNHMLTSGAREVTFYLNVTSDSRDLNDTDNTYSFTIPAKTQVNLQVTGISNPESVEGRVNTSATLSELFPVEVPTVPVTLASPQHLGPRLSHQYSITNSGPSPVLSLKVLLRLPLQLGTDIPLLYLLESLLTSGPIACSSPPLNPNGFNFTSHHGREGSDDMDVTGDVGTVNETADTDLSMTDIVSHPRGRRHRRQTDNDKDTDVVFNRTRMEDKGVLSCQLMSCAEVMCEVPTLRAGEVVTVTVSGYAVVASLKLLRRRSVLIKSSLEVEVQDAHYYDLINSDINNITASTQVAIIRKNEVGSRKFGWWHWLLVLLISFIIIIIIIIILKKVGFFERKRVPCTDTEILTEGDKNVKKDKDEEEEGQEKEV